MSFRFLGIEIERKTDVLAFAAFVISIGSIVAQFVNLVRGPEIILDGPKIVTLYSGTASNRKDYLRIAAGFTYLNKGSPGYDDILKSESVTVEMDKISLRLTAKNYIETSGAGKNMERVFKNDAIPVALKSGAVTNHETEFFPFPGNKTKEEYDQAEISQFLSMLEKSASLRIKFLITTYEGEQINKECTLKPKKVASNLKDGEKTINSKQRSWAASVCA